METNTPLPKNIDEYIAGFPQKIQDMLKEIRATIKKVAPEATEAIKYRMPTYILNGNLVHFAAMKNHIGFYPTPSGIDNFKKELAAYKSGKGSLQFPLDSPLPLDLISKIVELRVKENSAKAETRKTLKQVRKNVVNEIIFVNELLIIWTKVQIMCCLM